MNKSSYLKWEPQYSVGVEILDQQHRKLFDIVNDLTDEIDMGSKIYCPLFMILSIICLSISSRRA